MVTADLNDDGLIDIYVANDMNPNFLFLNRGDGTFDDVSEASGAAYDINGMAQSGMGVDAEDVDRQREHRSSTGFPSCTSPTSPTSTTPSTRTSARASSTTTPPSSGWPRTRCRS